MSIRPGIAVASLALLAWLGTGCGGEAGVGGFARQYEYEQDIYLDLDGSATIVLNASIPALVALNGLHLPLDSRTRIDRDAVRRAFESAVTDVTRVSRPWRRRGRRFVQVRLEVDDIRQLSKAAPFGDAAYQISAEESRRIVRGEVKGPKREPLAQAGWDGSEVVAYKLHLPSRIYFHNVRHLATGQTGSVERGNILRWEQTLTDRLDGKPIVMEVRMDEESILNRTLWLFAGSFAAAMALLGSAIWMTVRRGRMKSDSRLTTPRSSPPLPR
jgi:hypothetical protein